MYMASLIKGMPVVLHEKVRTGVDAFEAPIYTKVPVTVKNVLVAPVGESGGFTEDNQLNGKKAVYQLSIPKGDTHRWEDSTVEFWGQKWRTVGFVQQLMTANVPLDWDKHIRVERYG